MPHESQERTGAGNTSQVPSSTERVSAQSFLENKPPSRVKYKGSSSAILEASYTFLTKNDTDSKKKLETGDMVFTCWATLAFPRPMRKNVDSAFSPSFNGCRRKINVFPSAGLTIRPRVSPTLKTTNGTGKPNYATQGGPVGRRIERGSPQ
ncbi:unnamed protein product [Nesidiocoris tenuis]|uniref:Uncharacterized protein n=1 Tax=Nesidiocoris tenuis TaxID=355587 RepID=A0A6H5G8Z5_9HEMI|nr:unnamed protein product [Nesidiocoris tenuis]